MTTKWIASLAKAASNGTETTKKSSSLRQQSNGDNATTRECAAVVFAFFLSRSFSSRFEISEQLKTTENVQNQRYFSVCGCVSRFFLYSLDGRARVCCCRSPLSTVSLQIFLCAEPYIPSERNYTRKCTFKCSRMC